MESSELMHGNLDLNSLGQLLSFCIQIINEDKCTNNNNFRVSHFAFDDEYTDTTLRIITVEKKQ